MRNVETSELQIYFIMLWKENKKVNKFFLISTKSLRTSLRREVIPYVYKRAGSQDHRVPMATF
jgi:isochorismate hydrolase